jgi:hypothetical protein
VKEAGHFEKNCTPGIEQWQKPKPLKHGGKGNCQETPKLPKNPN